MPLSLKTKQVVGVTCIVGLAVTALTAWYLSSLVSIRLEEAAHELGVTRDVANTRLVRARMRLAETLAAWRELVSG